MNNAAMVIIAVFALWVCAAPCANSASLDAGRTKYNRDGRASALTPGKAPGRQRSAKADALLGFKYEHGFGVPQSFDVAADLYMRAAERGEPTGQYLLGLMYDKGHGVWRDEVLAHMWLNLAAARAQRRYRDYYLRLRNAVASKMTSSQIIEAQRLALEWAPKSRW